MSKDDDIFGLKLINIRIGRTRIEFNYYYKFVSDKYAEEVVKPSFREPIRLPNMLWLGLPEDLFTLLIQRAILGIESYLRTSVMYQTAICGKLTPTLAEKLRNPFSFGGGGTVENFYHKLPAQIDSNLSLKIFNPDLYDRNILFYRNVRNPLFHGRQLSESNIPAIRATFNHLHKLYEWIDSWHPENLWFQTNPDLIKNEMALVKCNQAIKQDPKNVQVLIYKGDVLFSLGRCEEALAVCNEAIRLEPKNSMAYNNTGVYLSKLDRQEEAIAAYDKAIILEPQYASPYYNLSCIYSLMGEREKMFSFLRDAIMLDPMSKEQAKTDADFKNYWNDPEFKSLINL